jgi:Leucine-rich repeat (LRR) protein
VWSFAASLHATSGTADPFPPEDPEPIQVDSVAEEEKAEPKSGCFPDGFDEAGILATRDRLRATQPFREFEPVFHDFSGWRDPRDGGGGVKSSSSVLVLETTAAVSSSAAESGPVRETVRVVAISDKSEGISGAKKSAAAKARKACLKVLRANLLGGGLCPFPELEVLSLRDLDLKAKHMPGKGAKECFLPTKLRVLDLRGNQIGSLSGVVGLLRDCKDWIQSVSLDGNPVCQSKSWRAKLIAQCPLLRTVNGEAVSLSERMEAIGKHGTKEQRKPMALEFIQFDFHFSAGVSLLKKMSVYDPNAIAELTLTDCDLTRCFVGNLPQLRKLDLSRNRISHLVGSGLEFCDKLERASFAHNSIGSIAELSVFALCFALADLDLRDNVSESSRPARASKEDNGKDDDSGKDPDTCCGAPLDKCRLYAIFLTKDLKGTNRMPGLQRLDRTPITLAERICAVELGTASKGTKLAKDAKKKSAVVAGQKEMWHLRLIEYFGHAACNTPGFFSRVRHLKLPFSEITFLDLSGFAQLEVIDLSGNELSDVPGLDDSHQHLKFLNLSGNSHLDLRAVLPRLKQHRSLKYASFFHDQMYNSSNAQAKDAKSATVFADEATYRSVIFNVLLPTCPSLSFLDNRPIGIAERIDALSAKVASKQKVAKLVTKFSKSDIDRFTFELWLAASCCAFAHELNPQLSAFVEFSSAGSSSLKWNSDSRDPDYDSKDITSMRKLDLKGIVNGPHFAANLTSSRFPSLIEINLSGNDLHSILGTNLDHLPSLRVLDVSVSEPSRIWFLRFSFHTHCLLTPGVSFSSEQRYPRQARRHWSLPRPLQETGNFLHLRQPVHGGKHQGWAARLSCAAER